MEIEQYLEAFERLKAGRKGEPSWLLRLREEAMPFFALRGFPTIRDDAWRYTDVTAIREGRFGRDGSTGREPSLSGMLNSPQEGVEVLDIMKALTVVPELLEKHLGWYADPEVNPFTALNTALFQKGFFVRISDGVILKEPIRIVHSAADDRKGCAFQLRTLILMGKGSKAAVLETYDSPGDQTYFTNAVAEIVLEEGAVLEHTKIQNEGKNTFHAALTQVVQGRGSRFTSLSVSTGSRLMRQEHRVRLAGEEADCALNGLSLAGKDQLLDYVTFIDHEKPSGKSRQLFKGLFSGNSRGVFTGKVLVRQDAQHTDAAQTNKNILLSDEAKVDTRPQLEILADDVKCSHGATVGPIQEDAVFYLKTRGIGEQQAGRMLAQGFAQEMIEAVAEGGLRNELMTLVNDKLEKQFI